MAITAAPSGAPATGPRRILLLEEHPDLALHVDPEHREQARSSISAPCLKIAPGPWEQAVLGEAGLRPFGAILLRGLMTRTLDFGGHPALEPYGPGDVIGAEPVQSSVLPAAGTWAVSSPARLAVLDDDFLIAARRWPRLVTGLFDLMHQQRDRLALQLVVAAQPRVEDRLTALFRLLSERHGRVTAAGVVVEISLTHEALGRLIGAQRPTVSLALKALRDRGAVRRLPGGQWLIAEQPGEVLTAGATEPPQPPAEPEARFALPSTPRTGTRSGT